MPNSKAKKKKKQQQQAAATPEVVAADPRDAEMAQLRKTNEALTAQIERL